MNVIRPSCSFWEESADDDKEELCSGMEHKDYGFQIQDDAFCPLNEMSFDSCNKDLQFLSDEEASQAHNYNAVTELMFVSKSDDQEATATATNRSINGPSFEGNKDKPENWILCHNVYSTSGQIVSSHSRLTIAHRSPSTPLFLSNENALYHTAETFSFETIEDHEDNYLQIKDCKWKPM